MLDYPAFSRLARAWADLAVALALEVALGTYLSIDHGQGASFDLVFLTIFAEPAYRDALIIAALVWLVRRRPWRAAASGAKWATFPLLIGPCLASGDYVHLALCYPTYRAEIAAGGGGAARFDWGDKSLWGPNGMQEDTLIYDPTDALAAAVDRSREAEEPYLGLATRHLAGHFYVERKFSH